MNAATGEQPDRTALDSATPGELLRAERERRRLSLQQAAEDLHLDTWVLEAMEADRFAALGAPVYAKGHLRKYASLLGLTPEAVIERYERLSDTPAAPTPIPASVNAPARIERISLKTPLLALAVLISLGAGWQLFEWLTSPPAESVVAMKAPPAAANPEAEASPPGAVEGVSSQSAPASPQGGEREPEPVVEPPATQAPPLAAGSGAEPQVATASGPQISLRLEFSEPSWTEVYDGDGARLMFDLGAPGRVRNLSGTPPLQVTLGAAAAVRAQVNGEPVMIPRSADRNASRFTIDAAGVITPQSNR